MPAGIYDRKNNHTNKGKTRSIEWKQKLGEANKNPSEETRKKMREAHKGNENALGCHHSLEARKKMREAMKGNTNNKGKHWNCKGIRISPINKTIRQSPDMKDWIKKVFERDDYICQICHQKGGKLNTHHIEEFSKYPEKRFDINNGLTLCKSCHKLVHKSAFIWTGENMIHGGA